MGVKREEGWGSKRNIPSLRKIEKIQYSFIRQHFYKATAYSSHGFVICTRDIRATRVSQSSVFLFFIQVFHSSAGGCWSAVASMLQPALGLPLRSVSSYRHWNCSNMVACSRLQENSSLSFSDLLLLKTEKYSMQDLQMTDTGAILLTGSVAAQTCWYGCWPGHEAALETCCSLCGFSEKREENGDKSEPRNASRHSSCWWEQQTSFSVFVPSPGGRI